MCKQVAFVLRCFLVCGFLIQIVQASIDDHEMAGFWEATIEGEDFIDRYIYHLFIDDSGELKGIVYVFRDGQKKSETVIDSLSYKKRILYMVIKTQVLIEYKGLFISENLSIGGELYYPNGISVPWTLKKLKIQSIEQIYDRMSFPESSIHFPLYK